MTAIDRFDPFELRIVDAIDEIAAARTPTYLDDVLQLTARTSQRRGWSLPERLLTVNALRLAMTGLVAVVAAGALVSLLLFNGGRVGPSQPAATASDYAPATSTAPAPGLPDALSGTWFGRDRTLPGLGAGAGTVLHVGPNGLALTSPNQANVNLIAVSASDDGGKLAISTSSGPSDGCQPGQTGRYAYALSPSGQTLVISAESDACAQRVHLFEGAWWLADCRMENDACLGALDAGDYGSEFFASIGAQGVPWAAHYGSLTFTVPVGWANHADWPSAFGLSPIADFTTAGTSSGEEPAVMIGVYSNVLAESQATGCSGRGDGSIEPGAAAYIAWLRGIPELSVGRPSNVTIGGEPATMVDISLASPPTRLCDGEPVVEYLYSAGWSSNVEQGNTGTQMHRISAGNRDRLIVMDMPSGYLTVILITTADGTRFDAFAQQAMPIVESFKFNDAFPAP